MEHACRKWRIRFFQPVGAAILLCSMLYGCERSHLHGEAALCSEGTMRCSGDRVQHCPLGVWQTLDNCALFSMTCSEEAGRVGCVPSGESDSEPSIDTVDDLFDTDTVSDAGTLEDAGTQDAGTEDGGD